MLKNHRDYFLLLVITFFGAFLRFWYLVAPAGQAQTITPDEAVYGIQVLRILDGHRPVFYAAQPYTGTLSAYLSALLFGIFGISWFWLKLIPFLFSVAFVPLNFLLALKIFRKRTLAYTAAFFSALGTPFWLNWASRAGTGYPEAAVIGNLILILTIGIIYRSKKSPVNSPTLEVKSAETSKVFLGGQFFALGFLAGLGFWIQPTIAYYILPCALFILWWRPKIIISLESLAAIVGAAIGCFPVIWYNLKFGGITSRSLFVKSWGIKAALYKLVTEGFPVLVGVRRPFSTRNFFTPLAGLIFILYLVAFVLLVWKRAKLHFDEIPFPSFWGPRAFGGLQNPGPGQARTKDSGQARMTEKCGTSVFSFKKTKPPDLFLALLASIILIFSLSPPFNQFVIEPRYVFAFYSTLPLLAAFLVYQASRRAFLLSGAVTLAFVINAVMGVFWASPLSFADPYQLDNVIKILRENKVYYINADEATGHRVTFQTERGVTAAIRTGGMSEQRFLEYQQAVLDAHPSQRGYVFLKDSPLLRAMEEEIKHFSPKYKKEIVDDMFVVLVPQ